MSFNQWYTAHFKHASLYGAISTSIGILFLIVYGYLMHSSSLHIVIFLGIAITGRVFWTFLEYMIHRFIFHKSDHRNANIHYILHGIHHAFPSETIFLPLWIRIPVLLLLSMCFIYIGGIYGYPFAFGFVLGFSVYGCIHYLMHHKTTIPFLQHLVSHHMHHHEIRSHWAYGVSTQFWDMLCKTMPPKS